MSMAAYFRSAAAPRENVFTRYSDLVLVAGVVAIVALMVLPLPLWLIDLLVAVNIASGIVLLWGMFAMLWMPWADHQKSYRNVALQLRSKIPVSASCMVQKGLGVSQAAALDYHGGIRARPFDIVRPNACPLMLVQGSPQHEFDGPGTGWVKLADVGRPGDRSERFRLYRLGK